MKKKKVLFVTEASFHPTGYSVYTKEILKRLSKHPELEVAELGCFSGPEAEEIKDIPWKFYANIPDANNHEAMNFYNASMANKFGEFSFNNVLLDFQPDFVMDIRDWWMLEFEERSPFRDFFNWAIMPTVDAEPQASSWIDTYSSANGVFAYSEFGRDTMLKQSKNINFIDVASPCASNSFFPIKNKKELRNSFGLEEDIIIFGTVMRNQRRKLYNDLFKAFKIFIDNNPDMKNVYLYCHTAYPDVGWDIPELIKENGLGNKVLMTYKCKNCGDIKPLFFNDSVTFCYKCNTFSSAVVGISNKINEDELNKVYNLFDVYIQWANSEGWGMPQLEAAYAGLPVISIEYSAMESLINNIKGVGIKPLALYKELETGCNRAIPDNKALAATIESLSLDKSKRNYIAKKCYENSKEIYNWDYAANKWLNYFLNAPVLDKSQTWESGSRLFTPQTSLPSDIANMTTSDQISWLFIHVLGKPELINQSMWKRMVKDLTYRATLTSTIPGYYYNDYSHPDMEKRYEEFNIEKAFHMCLNMRSMFNDWENARLQKLGAK
jgi:glycosyltransferase involved in cell wall biosynthesis